MHFMLVGEYMGLAKALGLCAGWFKHIHEQHFSVNNSKMNYCKCNRNTLYMLMSAYVRVITTKVSLPIKFLQPFGTINRLSSTK